MSISPHTVVIHLSSDDHYKAGKALRFASKALTYVENAVIYLSAQGVNVAKRSSGGFTIPGTDLNSLDAIREFLKDGGQVFAGKDCLKTMGISAMDIIAGCEQADPNITFKYLLADDTKMISW